MTAFSTGVAALFADPNLAEAAIYRPAAGGSASIRAIRTQPGATVASPFDVGVSQASYGADIRVSDVAAPVEGDTIEFADGSTFRVRKKTRDTLTGLVWRLDLDRAS